MPREKSARLGGKERPHYAAFPKFIEIIRPRVHHCDAFGPILGTVRVRSANSVRLLVSELALDGVRFQRPISLSRVAAMARNPCVLIASDSYPRRRPLITVNGTGPPRRVLNAARGAQIASRHPESVPDFCIWR
jgi:hypothetical protein